MRAPDQSLFKTLLLASLVLAPLAAPAQQSATENPLSAGREPWNIQAFFQGGVGLTDDRNGFRFLLAGVQAGRVLTPNVGPGPLRGNFEFAVQVIPYFEAFTPVFPRVKITPINGGALYAVSAPYNVGGTFHGASITPVIFRWNFARAGKLTPWAQAAGGVIYTTHKFPSYGNTSPTDLNANGPNGETSVWNFDPQGGIGLHYFLHPNRSVDFSVNAEHISSASLGDRNPGVNASLQFALGYSWWK